MPDMRYDPLRGELVIIATERAKRPETLAGPPKKEKAELPPRVEKCPFCPGNEKMTPPELLVYPLQKNTTGGDNVSNWSVRVIPNKFPALEKSDTAGADIQKAYNGDGFFESYPGYGAHEVIIETPLHNRQLGDLTEDELTLVLKSFKQRLLSLAEDPNLRYVQIFRNHGSEAGASIEHPHCQVMALPYIPPQLEKEYNQTHNYYLDEGSCLLCTLMAEEERAEKRILLKNELFTAYIPFAAHLPFTTFILPREHSSSLEISAKGWEEALAPLLLDYLSMLKKGLQDPPYNLYLHTAPLRSDPLPYYHWHIEIIPKLTVVAGWEIATGSYINIARPEEAAEYLRNGG